jgi:putative holliday junction resolvase
MTRLLGVDLGERRIGLAVGDTTSGSVVPLATTRRATPERDSQTLARIAAEQRIDELVIGLPLSLDGSEGPQAATTREWAAAVADTCAMSVSWRDERMTTEDALRQVGGPGRGRSGGPPSAAARRAHRARLDRLAAAAIVQAEMDARASAAAAAEGAVGASAAGPTGSGAFADGSGDD